RPRGRTGGDGIRLGVFDGGLEELEEPRASSPGQKRLLYLPQRGRNKPAQGNPRGTAMSRPSSEPSGRERVTFVSEDAPEVARGFVPRPEAAEALRCRIAGGGGPTSPVVVLYGPAGTGKTALVAAIGPELAGGTAGRRRVVWLSLGRASEHLDGLMHAIGVIERHDGRPPSSQERPDPAEEMMSYLLDPSAFETPDPSQDLRDWLRDCACLLVLD